MEPLHAWPEDEASARAIQHVLRERVQLTNDFVALDVIAGVDVSYDLARNVSMAFVVTMRRGMLKPIASVRADLPTHFPYIPGLLSFREIPVILEALRQLPLPPDVLMVDGQGVAHPLRFGIAAHLGVLTGLPSIGIAKSRLTGRYLEPGPRPGDTSPLLDKQERIGTVLRSKAGCLPLYVSPGHRMDQETASALVVECLRGYRLPEPTRIADKLSKQKGRDRLAAPLLDI